MIYNCKWYIRNLQKIVSQFTIIANPSKQKCFKNIKLLVFIKGKFYERKTALLHLQYNFKYKILLDITINRKQLHDT
jgi:hypothetical protein